MITNHYPMGNAEAFAEAEIPFLAQSFELTVITLDSNAPQTRELPEGVRLIVRKEPSKLLLAVKSLMCLFSSEVKQELKSGGKRFQAAWGHAKALTFSRFFKRKVGCPTEDFIAYTYWIGYETAGLCLLKNNCKSMRVISRFHRGDFYKTDENPYLYYRRSAAMQLDKAFFISEEGQKYFFNNYNCEPKNSVVSKLGSLPQKYKKPIIDNTLYIVSCSNMLAIKKIDKIIDALSMLDIKINWKHFGDGLLRSDLEKKAAEKLSDRANISYEFMGYLQHNELMEYYKNNRVDLLVNASDMEGIPVSFMEAISFGIPVIAPEVGGIPEIIDNECGHLLAPNFDAEDIANAVRSFCQTDRVEMSEKAYKKWDENFNAENNYKAFIEQAVKIL